mgnify:FL=1
MICCYGQGRVSLNPYYVWHDAKELAKELAKVCVRTEMEQHF